MTSKEFTIWLKGFTEGVHEFNITPKQWDLLKEKLAEVNDGTPIGEGGWGTPNTTPNINRFPNWQQPHISPYPNDPFNPYKVYCGDETGTTGITNPPYTLTTTPGHGSITIANPNLVSWGTSSLTTTTNAKFPISGSNVTYTTYQPYTTQTNDDFEKKILNEIKNKGVFSESKFKKRKAKSVKEWEDEIDLGGHE
jgi:hypothetical protein